MRCSLSAPIGLLDEHPEWSSRLIAELEARHLPYEKIDHSNHFVDPCDRVSRYSVIVNRTSPSSYTRGHRSVLFFAEAVLTYYESLGVPVINPVAAYRFEKSKALQLDLFERLGIPYPRSIVVNHPDQARKALDRLRLPVLVKPNVGGSGAGIVRFESREDFDAALEHVAFGPDHTGVIQEYIEPEGGAIVRVEVMDGRDLYAIRLVRNTPADFNLCPADVCRLPTERPGGPGPPRVAPDLAACPTEVGTKPATTVTRFDPPKDAIDAAIKLTRAASIDIGGVEYLVDVADGQRYFYDINATSNFVANAPAILGWDPFPLFVDYIVRIATERR